MASACGCGPAPGAPSFPPGGDGAGSVWPAEPGPTVLPAQSRLRDPREFRAVLRQGVRVGRPSLVMHARPNELAASRVGLIVSKAVGNAVQRNRVKRRLRHLSREAISGTPLCADFVVRALPTAVEGSLAADFEQAFKGCLEKIQP